MRESLTNESLCKFCESKLQQRFVDILLPQHTLATHDISHYLLPTFVCPSCFLVQTDESYLPAPEQIYSSSFGSTHLHDVKHYTERMFEKFEVSDQRLEVSLWKKDPESVQEGDTFFGTDGIHAVIDMYGQADLINSHNELLYSRNINDFVRALKLLLKPTGIITMEFLHLLPLFHNQPLQNIHSNHFMFLSLTTIDKIMKKFSLTVFDLDLSSTPQTLKVSIKHSDNTSNHITKSVMNLRGVERAMGMSSLACYTEIRERLVMSND